MWFALHNKNKNKKKRKGQHSDELLALLPYNKTGAGSIPGVGFARSHCVSVGSPWVLKLPLMLQKLACGVNWQLQIGLLFFVAL